MKKDYMGEAVESQAAKHVAEGINKREIELFTGLGVLACPTVKLVGDAYVISFLFSTIRGNYEVNYAATRGGARTFATLDSAAKFLRSFQFTKFDVVL